MNSSSTLDQVRYRNVPVSAVSGTSSRAQSETVGVILLTAVIVVLVGGFSLVYLGTLDDGSGNGPVVDANIEATDENVTIMHRGGESIPYADLDVVLRRDAATERHDLEDWSGSDDATFDPAERVRGNHSMGRGRLTVLVVHTGSNAVIAEAYLDANGGEEEDDDETASVTAAFTPNSTEPEPGEAVVFDASDSTAEGTITSYEWNGDGPVDDSGEAVTHTFENPGTYTVSLAVTDAEGNTDRSSRSLTVVETPPIIESTSLTDGDDDLVTSGDLLTVSATVESGSSDIDTVIADASSFDAGEVMLTDDNDDGIYDATFVVGESATDGDQNVAIEVRDAGGATVSAETENSITIDTTPPAIETFDVTDNSGSIWFVPYVSYDVEWSVADERLASTTVFVNDTTATDNPQETYQGASGFESSWEIQDYDRTYRFRILAVDEAGNSQCALLVDEPNDGTPPSSAAC